MHDCAYERIGALACAAFALPDWDYKEGPDRPGLTHEIRSLILQLASERKVAVGLSERS